MSGGVNLTPDLATVLDRLKASDLIPPGSIRMVAIYDGVLDGLEATPRVDQATGRTVALVHLRYPSEVQPRKDINLVSEFRRTLGKEDDSATQINSVEGSAEHD